MKISTNLPCSPHYIQESARHQHTQEPPILPFNIWTGGWRRFNTIQWWNRQHGRGAPQSADLGNLLPEVEFQPFQEWLQSLDSQLEEIFQDWKLFGQKESIKRNRGQCSSIRKVAWHAWHYYACTSKKCTSMHKMHSKFSWCQQSHGHEDKAPWILFYVGNAWGVLRDELPDIARAEEKLGLSWPGN